MIRFLIVLVIFFSPFGISAKRPNILLIVSEDNGPELGCYGEPYVQTPNLDRLASRGILFEKAYVPQAGCSQSRAAYLTGLYPHQNGQIGLATWKFRLYEDSVPNLVSTLKKAGYRTGLIGKLHVNPSSAFPFDFKKISTANFSRKKLSNYTKEAKAFIEDSQQPFFLNVNYPDAHRPFLSQVAGLPKKPLTAKEVTPLAYFGLNSLELRQQTAYYYNCISRLDSKIGELIETLQKSGKLENTLIIYLGDHGADLLRGKRTCYEGGTRIPLIISWPSNIVSDSRRKELVSSLDLFPTIIDAAGLNLISGLAGRSLLPLFKKEPVSWRQHIFTEYHLHSAHNFFPQRAVRNHRYKLIQNLLPNQTNPGYNFTRKKFIPRLPEILATSSKELRSAYQCMEKPPEFELYDLESDPYEFVNLAYLSQHASTLKNLRTTLRNWRGNTNDPLLKAENLNRLKAEIESCFTNGSPDKSDLHLTYPQFFFSK